MAWSLAQLFRRRVSGATRPSTGCGTGSTQETVQHPDCDFVPLFRLPLELGHVPAVFVRFCSKLDFLIGWGWGRSTQISNYEGYHACPAV